jgi:hypothetical protein
MWKHQRTMLVLGTAIVALVDPNCHSAWSHKTLGSLREADS